MLPYIELWINHRLVYKKLIQLYAGVTLKWTVRRMSEKPKLQLMESVVQHKREKRINVLDRAGITYSFEDTIMYTYSLHFLSTSALSSFVFHKVI